MRRTMFWENYVSKQNLRDNAARLKKKLEMKFGSEKVQLEIEEDTTLKNTHKRTTEMTVTLLTIKEQERNRGRGIMKKMKEKWDNIYESWTVSVQTLIDNAPRSRKHNTLLYLTIVRGGSDIEPKAIDIRAIEPVAS